MTLEQENQTGETLVSLSDGSVFGTTYKTYYHPLCFYASKIVGEHAEDVVENLFIKLWDKKQVFNDSGHLRAFLYHATRNACLDFLKSDKRRAVSADVYPAEDAGTDHLQTLIEAETYAEIYRAVHSLPAQCAKVIELGFFEGFSNKEIAQKLGLSEQTVKNHKLRALNLLKEKLSGRAFLLVFGLI